MHTPRPLTTESSTTMELTRGRATAVDSSFADFYRREFSRTVALARSLCGSWAVAEELTQDAFLVAHRRWAKVGTYDDPGQWVRRVVANRSVSAYRRKLAERRALGRAGAPVEPPDPHDANDGLLRGLLTLPPKQAQAIAAVYVDGLDAREAAELLGCSESTLRTHLQRGRAALRSYYDTHHDTMENDR